MREVFDSIETPYVDCQTLLAHLTDYRNPRDWIARMVKQGELLRLKNGFFLIVSRFRKKADYPYEQIANLLYGPSYISLEWALSFYGFIPERVSVVTSVTIGSNKEFATPIGVFTYMHLSSFRYSVGINHKAIEGQLGGFLIATPEKALADWLFFTCEDMSEEELLQELLEAKRIEVESLQTLNKTSLKEIVDQYASDIIRKLYNIVNKL